MQPNTSILTHAFRHPGKHLKYFKTSPRRRKHQFICLKQERSTGRWRATASFLNDRRSTQHTTLYKAVAQMLKVGTRYRYPETNHPPSVANRKTNGKWGSLLKRPTQHRYADDQSWNQIPRPRHTTRHKAVAQMIKVETVPTLKVDQRHRLRRIRVSVLQSPRNLNRVAWPIPELFANTILTSWLTEIIWIRVKHCASHTSRTDLLERSKTTTAMRT